MLVEYIEMGEITFEDRIPEPERFILGDGTVVEDFRLVKPESDILEYQCIVRPSVTLDENSIQGWTLQNVVPAILNRQNFKKELSYMGIVFMSDGGSFSINIQFSRINDSNDFNLRIAIGSKNSIAASLALEKWHKSNEQ